MTKLSTLLDSFEKGEISFEQLLLELEHVEWAVLNGKDEESWWSNDNTSAVVDLYFYEGVITAEQRKRILSAS